MGVRVSARTSRRTPRAGIQSAVAAAVRLRWVCRGKLCLQLLACTDVPVYTNATGRTWCLSSQEHYLYRSRCLHSDHLEVVILPSTGITGAFCCTEQGVLIRITLMLSLCRRYCLSDRGNLKR